MKKKLLLLALISFMLIGCSSEPEPPTNYDVNENKEWAIWAKGTIAAIEKIRLDRCSHKEIRDTCWFNYRYTFKDGTSVLLRRMKDPGLVKIGQSGTLYKLGASNSHFYAEYQWMQEGTVAIIPAKKGTESILLIDYDEPSVWVDSSQKNPKRYTPVLVKFKNETLTIGYINNLNEWKLSINKREDDGGRTIPNNEIIFWKSLDIR